MAKSKSENPKIGQEYTIYGTSWRYFGTLIRGKTSVHCFLNEYGKLYSKDIPYNETNNGKGKKRTALLP
jgi:hypothetical protein